MTKVTALSVNMMETASPFSICKSACNIYKSMNV